MKHISEAIALEKSKPETEKRQDSARPMRVWVQLADMFGKAFFRENDDQPTPLWINAIGRMTDKQIATGLANLGNDDLAFPPNLSQFVSACKRVENKPPYWNNTPQLEDKREPGTMSYADWLETQ